MSVKLEEKTDSIGDIAGMIWKHLAQKRSASALELKTALAVKNSLLFMALGWLARENKIELTNDKGIYYFKLTDK